MFVLARGEAFRVERNGAGLAALVERPRAGNVGLVAVEATGGFESGGGGGAGRRRPAAGGGQPGTGPSLRQRHWG